MMPMARPTRAEAAKRGCGFGGALGPDGIL